MTIIPLHIHADVAGQVPQSILHALLDALTESLQICLLVIFIMTLIEIFNVVSHGHLFRRLENHKIGQVAVASGLGMIPGCLGGFAGVSLYSHRMVGFGALTSALIATTGDEAFLMLTMFPSKAILIMGGLFLFGLITGIITDLVIKALQKKGKLLDLGADRCSDDNYETDDRTVFIVLNESGAALVSLIHVIHKVAAPETDIGLRVIMIQSLHQIRAVKIA